jgi:hypothetical protein
MGWAITDRPSADNLISTFSTTGVALFTFLLATQLYTLGSIRNFISKHGGKWPHG